MEDHRLSEGLPHLLHSFIKPCVEAQARPRIPVLIVNESCLPFFVLSLHERHFFSLWPLPF
jgi:hypothetical protein